MEKSEYSSLASLLRTDMYEGVSWLNHGTDIHIAMLGRTSIEIVPIASLLPELETNPYAPFVVIEGNMGVPQKALYKAYMSACRAFATAQQTGDTEALLQSTSVVLLANSAHSSALNARKRLILRGAYPVDKELVFVALLLSEQQAAKSSIIWHHRRWLLGRLHGHATLDDRGGIQLVLRRCPLNRLRERWHSLLMHASAIRETTSPGTTANYASSASCSIPIARKTTRRCLSL